MLRPSLSFALVSLVAVGAAFVLRPAPEEWDPIVEPYVAFVENTRGLEFTNPVTVMRADVAAELNSAQDVPDEAFVEGDGDRLGYDPYGEAIRLLGLTGPLEDYGAAFGDVREASAAAFYDPATETIVLPVGPVSPMLELTIVHELTHALQHQNGLLSYTDFESWTSASLRNALIEGDATLVEQLWYDTLPPETRRQVDQSWNSVGAAPDGFLQASFSDPYALGLPLVTMITADGNYDELNSMLRQKSLGSDERLVDPLTPSATPVNSARSTMVDPDGNEWFDGWIGAFAWYRAIAPGVGAESAIEAIHGYDDDVFVAFERDGEICARFDVWFNSGIDAAQFGEVVATWGVETERIGFDRSSVRFDLCEPIGNPADQVNELSTPLVVSNWMAVRHQLVAEDRVARCAASAQATAVGFVPQANVDWDALEAESGAAREACGAG